MSRPPQDLFAPLARVQRDDSSDSYADMDSICNALSLGWEPSPEPEISGEAIAFALSARSQPPGAHACAPTSQARGALAGWPLEMGAEEQHHGALVWRESGVQWPASSANLFQRTQSDPAAKRAREGVLPLAPQSRDTISVPSEAGSNADPLSGKRLKSGDPTHAATRSMSTGGRIFDVGLSQEFPRSPSAAAAWVQPKSRAFRHHSCVLCCAALLGFVPHRLGMLRRRLPLGRMRSGWVEQTAQGARARRALRHKSCQGESPLVVVNSCFPSASTFPQVQP